MYLYYDFTLYSLPRPASKLLLTEEKMAAKMHNLSISNDHSYHLNGLQTNLAGSNGVISDLPYSSMAVRYNNNYR